MGVFDAGTERWADEIVAGKEQAGMESEGGGNCVKAIEMTEIVLGNGARPMGDVAKYRGGGDL